jgi:hypothetical protein
MPTSVIIPHKLINSHPTLQNVPTPDINLERDIVLLGGEEVAQIAVQTGSNNNIKNKESQQEIDKRFRINVSTIIVSVFLFLMILAFFDLLQTAFFQVLSSKEATEDIVQPSVKLFYFILVTILVLSLIGLLYYYNQDIL